MFTFPLLQNQPLRHGVSAAAEGNIDLRFSSADQVASSLKSISSALNLDPRSIVQAEQIHATNVALVDSSHRGQVIQGADALVTKDPSVVLMLRIADCPPVILYDPTNHALGLVHSGWRGIIGKIGLTALEQMMLHFHTNPGNLLVAIGPCLSTLTLDHSPLQQDLPEWHAFITRKNNSYTINLLDFVTHTFQAAGVPAANIENSGINTQTSPAYFSYIRSQLNNEPDGRFAALAKLNPQNG